MAPAMNKSKVLLALNDARLVSYLEKNLDKFHKLLRASGDDLLKKIYSEVPHIILIDESFEGKKGLETAEALKEDALLKYIPLILLVERPPQALAWTDESRYTFEKKGDPAELLVLIERALARSDNELDLNPLTRLPGIRSTVIRIERAIASKKPFAVCSVDLSNLEAFNRAYGDSRGDDLIIKIGEIILGIVNQGAPGEFFVGHLGGDDFLVVADPMLAIPIAKMIIRSLDETIPNFYEPNDRHLGYVVSQTKDGRTVRHPIMSVCIAVVQNNTFPIDSVAEISRVAGILQKKMKTLPGSCYMKNREEYYETITAEEPQGVYAPGKAKGVQIQGLTEKERNRLFEEVVLRGRKISTVYQPIVDLKTRQIMGYEALTRGVPDSPFQDPTLMFHTAREIGQVRQLDRLCLDMALKNGQTLPPDRKLNVNLNHETLIDQKSIKHIFTERGELGFKDLVVEITEESILGSFEKMRNTLLSIKEQGASVAIDDIGGGAVSLRDVAILRPEYIKFDRSLIRQIDKNTTKQRIVLSMLLFANGIGAITTAEGIETKEEYETMLSCGVQLGQGYFFARPNKQFITSLDFIGS